MPTTVTKARTEGETDGRSDGGTDGQKEGAALVSLLPSSCRPHFLALQSPDDASRAVIPRLGCRHRRKDVVEFT